MSLIDTPEIVTLTRALDLAAMRHGLISSNMANVDTPGYRTRDIDFQAELGKAQIYSSVAEHPPIRQVKGLVERPDGNNVSLERESLLLSDNQLRYRMATELLRAEFHRLLSAINEGR
ncbi:MAG TPA: flagellar basal body protein [Terriglobales bacterium]|nr:flagellar basal body protein [Terriglobales bacterium]